MNVSQAGIDLIKEFEGLRLEAYRDAVGVWTIGYGHTETARPGMKITEAEAEALLRYDIDKRVPAIERALKVKVTQNQFDAIVSFVFNVGVGAFRSSTLLKNINRGDIEDEADEFDRWVYAGGKKLPGLVRRRAAERALFESVEAPPPPTEVTEWNMPVLSRPYQDSTAARLFLHLVDGRSTSLPANPGALEFSIKRYQRDNDLVIDGIAGKDTWGYLLRELDA